MGGWFPFYNFNAFPKANNENQSSLILEFSDFPEIEEFCLILTNKEDANNYRNHFPFAFLVNLYLVESRQENEIICVTLSPNNSLLRN